MIVEMFDCVCGGKDIVWIDVESGICEVFVVVEWFVFEGFEKVFGVDDYQWLKDGKCFLFFINVQCVWCQKMRGDYWVVGFEDGLFW